MLVARIVGCFVVFGSIGLVGLHLSPISDDKDSLLIRSDGSSHMTSCQALFDTTTYCKDSVFDTATLILAREWIRQAHNSTESLSIRCHNVQLQIDNQDWFDPSIVEEACSQPCQSLSCLGYLELGKRRRKSFLKDDMLRSMYTSLSFQPPAANSSAGDYDVIVFVDGSSRLEIPMYHYATRIPAYARTVHIISSCPQQHHCDVEYIGNLTSYLRAVFPQSSCTTERVSSEWSIVSAILSAPSVVCNDASICVLRSLQGKQTFIADNKSRFPWLSDLLNVPLPTVAFQVPGNASSFPPPHSCLALRGRAGTWVQDWEYAKTAQYTRPLTKWSQFSNLTSYFRTTTTYRWEDKVCPLQRLVTRQGFCDAMKTLGLRRVLFVGDSLNGHMAMSLWKLLGHDDDPQLPGHPGKLWTRNVSCGGDSVDDFVVTMYRNDHLDDSNVTNDLRHKCCCGRGDFCLAWLNEYLSSDDPTLLITNFGAHVYSTQHFEREFDEFLKLLEEHQKPQDVVVYRTTVPGHVHCENASQPLTSYDEFAPMLHNAPHSWDRFEAYNRYVQEKIALRNREPLQRPVHVLDVVPMTVLRPDGHVSGPERCDDCPDNDCLHYILPGPTDWWNHLLFSNLVDLASI